jgi:toxin ParE1/3/4
MSTYDLSPRARADLREIWNYTRDRWSVEQADRYIRELNRTFATIAHDPRRGRPCDDIRPGYRKYRVGAHMIFFRSVSARVEVIRVLHQSMDFERHL